MTQETPAAVQPAPAAPAPAPAPAAPAAPAPAPAAPAPAASLIPAAPAAPAPAPAPAPNAVSGGQAPNPGSVPGDPTWFLSDGVAGQGAAPAWFKADKYKSVDKQAEAYVELEKRFGAFTGAPKDGKYEFKMPEGITGEFDQEHPLLKGFNEWAQKRNLSNEGYNELLGMFAQYEASMAPNMVAIKASLGENADQRIAAAAQWAHANMTASQYAKFQAATSGANAADVFEVLELAIAKSRQVALPAPGAEVRQGGPTTKALIDIERQKKGPDGKFLFFTDEKHRAKVDAMEREYYAQMAAGGQ